MRMTPGTLKPTGAPETIVTDCRAIASMRTRASHSTATGRSTSTSARRRMPARTPIAVQAKGQDPCPLLEKHAGIWKFDENKSGQTQDAGGTRFATGLRQMPAITWHEGELPNLCIARFRDPTSGGRTASSTTP
jgi:hypothetical protein